MSNTTNDIIYCLTPRGDRLYSIIAIGCYMVGILILWHVPVLKGILYPFKLITVAFHEFGHAITAVCTGGKVKGIKIDPDEGGVTLMSGGIDCVTLPAGYLGSALIGAIMIFCGFNKLASSIISAIIGILLLVTIHWAKNCLAIFISVLFLLIIIGALVIEYYFHVTILRWFVLFMGVMSNMYSVWDMIDDLVLRKVNISDASRFAKLCHCPAQLCGFLWFCVGFVCLACAIVGGLLAFCFTNNSYP